ncbi:hypothetical protein [Desulfocicer niacini]
MVKEHLKSGPKPFAADPVEIEKFIKETYSNLSEKDRREYAAKVSCKLIDSFAMQPCVARF